MKIKLLVICLLLIQHASAQTLLGGMPLPNGGLYAIEKIDSTVYIGGFFSQVSGMPRTDIASFNAATGVLNSWSPVVANNGVTTITRVGAKLIVGGSFSSVNSQMRYGIAMFDLATGNLDSWSDTANFPSWRQGVAAYNNTFYYCRIINPSGACRVVCVDVLTGNFTPWQSDSAFGGGSDINAIYASGTYVYVGGVFYFTGGNSVYNNLCRFSQSTGALDTAWHPQPNVINFGITSIVKTNSDIFVGGDFNTINSQTRKGVAGYDLNGNLTNFNQNSSSYEVLSLCADGNYIWVGGNSSTLGGQLRYRIAQIRISNSTATCWNASATSSAWSTVQAIYVSGDTVYAGPTGSPALSVFINSPLPQPGDTISGPDSVMASQVATYSVPFVSGHTYYWNITGGTGSSTTNSINVTWGAGPGGTVRVVENNPSASNCYSDTIALQVSISFSTALSAVTSQSETIFSVFPNPAKEEVTIYYTQFSSGDNIVLRVFDMIGREIFSFQLRDSYTQLNTVDLYSGIYFVQIETDDAVLVRKLIKE